MKSILVLIFILAISNLSIGQHTKGFKKIVFAQSPASTEEVDIKYKSGKQKQVGTLAIYELNNYVYTFLTGKWINYYKSGQILTEAHYDNFGNPITWKMYDGKGNLLRESKAISIDTDAKDFNEFLKNKNSVNILTYEKKYKYTYKACKWFLASEGKMLNYKKTGAWKKYFDEGKIKKIVEY
ncbi:hypothetical protein [Seonamhaeicola sp.]|uniref:hypothetical protein n=1 Tax=Seonamhaeicola sp. TaxID=1912245 RepID=UPI002620A36D|nr:hypothetical protein [Seonamhaeicola sp.]